MNYIEKYQQWLCDGFFDETTRRELAALTGSKTAFTGIWSSGPAACGV